MSKTQYQLGRWALTDLIPDSEGPAMDNAFTELEQAVARIEQLREALTPSIDSKAFGSALKQAERVGYLIRQ